MNGGVGIGVGAGVGDGVGAIVGHADALVARSGKLQTKQEKHVE